MPDNDQSTRYIFRMSSAEFLERRAPQCSTPRFHQPSITFSCIFLRHLSTAEEDGSGMRTLSNEPSFHPETQMMDRFAYAFWCSARREGPVLLKQFLGEGHVGWCAVAFPAVVRTMICNIFGGADDSSPTFHEGHHGVFSVHQRMLADGTPV